MQKKWTHVALGAAIGTAVSLALVAPNFIPKALAEDAAAILTASKSDLIDMFEGQPAAFFKPDWTIEPSVSTIVESTATVRKIEGGRTSFVTVATTASGVYSSDGLVAGNVRYPGIHAEGQAPAALAMLVGGSWSLIRPMGAGSFAQVIHTPTGGSVVTNGGSCHVINGSVFC